MIFQLIFRCCKQNPDTFYCFISAVRHHAVKYYYNSHFWNCYFCGAHLYIYFSKCFCSKYFVQLHVTTLFAVNAQQCFSFWHKREDSLKLDRGMIWTHYLAVKTFWIWKNSRWGKTIHTLLITNHFHRRSRNAKNSWLDLEYENCLRSVVMLNGWFKISAVIKPSWRRLSNYTDCNNVPKTAKKKIYLLAVLTSTHYPSFRSRSLRNHVSSRTAWPGKTCKSLVFRNSLSQKFLSGLVIRERFNKTLVSP